MKKWIIYILLGLIQGIFEWFPISSEGIVALTSTFLLGTVNPIDLALFLHLGTLSAVLIYFREDWKAVLRCKDRELFRFLVISTFVSLLIGYPLYRIVRNAVVGNTLLLVMGGGLLITAFFHKKGIRVQIGKKKLAGLTGFLQALSVIPGVSRSGATIFGLSWGKLTPRETLKISYMMSAPVIVALTILLLLRNPTLFLAGWPALFSSALMGFLALHSLLRFSRRINFFKFALFFAIACFLGAALGFMVEY